MGSVAALARCGVPPAARRGPARSTASSTVRRTISSQRSGGAPAGYCPRLWPQQWAVLELPPSPPPPPRTPPMILLIPGDRLLRLSDPWSRTNSGPKSTKPIPRCLTIDWKGYHGNRETNYAVQRFYISVRACLCVCICVCVHPFVCCRVNAEGSLLVMGANWFFSRVGLIRFRLTSGDSGWVRTTPDKLILQCKSKQTKVKRHKPQLYGCLWSPCYGLTKGKLHFKGFFFMLRWN